MNDWEDFANNFQDYLKNNKGGFDKHLKIKFELDPKLIKFMMLVIWYLFNEYSFDLYETLERSPDPVHFWKSCQTIIEKAAPKNNVPNTARKILNYLYDHNLYNFHGEGL